MKTTKELQVAFDAAMTGRKYYKSVTVQHKDHINSKTGEPYSTKEFTIFYDLAPDYAIKGGGTVVRLDYEISDETLEDNDGPVFYDHLVNLFYEQVKYDLADALTDNNERLKLVLTGEHDPEILEIYNRLTSV